MGEHSNESTHHPQGLLVSPKDRVNPGEVYTIGCMNWDKKYILEPKRKLKTRGKKDIGKGWIRSWRVKATRESVIDRQMFNYSHSVVSLFTNTPISGGLKVIKERVFNDKTLQQRT